LKGNVETHRIPEKKSMNDYFIELFMIIGMGYFVYLFTTVLKFTHEENQFSDVRESAIDALLAIFIGWAAISGLFLLFSITGISAGISQEFGLWNVIRQILLYGIFFGPALIMMRKRHETLSSAGITRHNLGKSTLLGIILAAFMLLSRTMTNQFDIGEALRSISLNDFWALMTFLVVGIGEEFGFRGYLQTRLVLWSGKAWGWIIASILMAIAHAVHRITIMGMSGMGALLSSLSLIPISLLFGYIMLRTENIAGGTILHTFIDWSSVLWFM
jgi:membrane protease YdiL (CAAX protease family)